MEFVSCVVDELGNYVCMTRKFANDDELQEFLDEHPEWYVTALQIN